jgi:hypothetical protein
VKEFKVSKMGNMYGKEWVLVEDEEDENYCW